MLETILCDHGVIVLGQECLWYVGLYKFAMTNTHMQYKQSDKCAHELMSEKLNISSA